MEPDIPIQPSAPILPVPVPVPFPATATAPYASDEVTTSTIIPHRDPVLNDEQNKSLHEQGFTRSLGQALSNSVSEFALRIWIVDNSGSMSCNDGQKLVTDRRMSGVRSVSCTRWNEIKETIDYHLRLAALMKAPTKFRLLNNPGITAGQQFFSVGVDSMDEQMIDRDLEIAIGTMSKVSPNGGTPLITHINAIRDEVEALAPSLRREGRRVAVIIATDGLPTNPPGMRPGNERQNFIAAMKSLEGLPVWVVIRLCTDSEAIVDYYNELDKQLELSIEVLDNYADEAKEMSLSNPWLNYTLQLHRMREMGFQKRLFDILDERPLTLSELEEFCIMLFGEENFHGVPSPEVNLNKFIEATKGLVSKEDKQWNPVKMTMKSLLSVDKIKKVYGSGGGCTIM